jgi:hypothetical protein
LNVGLNTTEADCVASSSTSITTLTFPDSSTSTLLNEYTEYPVVSDQLRIHFFEVGVYSSPLMITLTSSRRSFESVPDKLDHSPVKVKLISLRASATSTSHSRITISSLPCAASMLPNFLPVNLILLPLKK